MSAGRLHAQDAEDLVVEAVAGAELLVFPLLLRDVGRALLA